ncbi:MAG TPA: hypothetical protein VKA61_12125 [Sphingomicrobium sp.]|nr:hypothetical protein [Sphingomicrobium sp.]
MVIQTEFGDIDDRRGVKVETEQFVWRDRIRIAFFRIHPSGRELICVCFTGYRPGQKLPRR